MRLSYAMFKIKWRPFLFFLLDDDQEGVMDNLLEALKTGSAFQVRERKDGGRRRTPRAAGGEFVPHDHAAHCCEILLILGVGCQSYCGEHPLFCIYFIFVGKWYTYYSHLVHNSDEAY